jgi:hypothetical protein
MKAELVLNRMLKDVCQAFVTLDTFKQQSFAVTAEETVEA